MENPCHRRDRKSFPLFCYCICILNKQLYTHLDLDCCRVRMLSGCFNCAPAYSSTSVVILTRILYDINARALFSEFGNLFCCIYQPV